MATDLNAQHRPARRLRSLGYSGGVRLEGRLGDRLADAVETYGGLPEDDILRGFRREAGLPAPGNNMGGWAAENSQMTFGQWVSGIARLSAVVGDRTLAEKAARLIDGYARTLPASGETGMNIYAWEKLACGLVDAAAYAGNDEALALLSRLARGERFDRTRAPATAKDPSGAEPHFSIEWYTLAENLYRGFLASGDGILADKAREWHYDAYWDRFRARPERGQPWGIPAWLHAYSHVNTFASVAAAYEVYGDEGQLEILRNAYDWLLETQTFATGGFGPHEFTMPEDGTLGRSLEWVTDSAEITCGSWAAFKLCSALLQHTGEARFAEWVEQLVYNGIGATVPVQPDGRTPYYADYRLGVGTKLPYWSAWPCCSGTYVQAVAHLADLVYFGADDGLAVALYVPSSVTWQHRGAQIRVRQVTDLPVGDVATFHIDVDEPTQFALRLREPSWSTMRVTVEGVEQLEPLSSDGWLVVDRTWNHGDTVTVDLGPRLRALPVDKQHPDRVAMAFGPVVLVQDMDWGTPFGAPLPWAMLDWESHLVRQGREMLFTPAQPGTHRMPPGAGAFRPFYEVPERVPYRMYHDLGAARIV